MLLVYLRRSAFLSVFFSSALRCRARIVDLYSLLAAQTRVLRTLVWAVRRLSRCGRGDVCLTLLLVGVVSRRRIRMALWVRAVRRVRGSHVVVADVWVWEVPALSAAVLLAALSAR